MTTGNLGLSSFAGQSVSSTDVLVRYTLLGDANLDRYVDGYDLTQIGSYWQVTGIHWFEGDFNEDTIDNITDLHYLTDNWHLSI